MSLCTHGTSLELTGLLHTPPPTTVHLLQLFLCQLLSHLAVLGIGNYREDFYKALLNIKDKGKPYLTDEQAKDIVDGYSDEALAYDMQTHTPEELAEINTM